MKMQPEEPLKLPEGVKPLKLPEGEVLIVLLDEFIFYGNNIVLYEISTEDKPIKKFPLVLRILSDSLSFATGLRQVGG